MKLLATILLLVALAGCTLATLTCDPDAPRSYDGTCNNLADPTIGSAGRYFSRGIEGAEFADGVSAPVNASRPNERVVSNALCRNDPALLDDNNHSMFITMFGQFVNHDLEDNRNTHTNPQDNVFNVAVWVQEFDDSFCIGPVSRTNATIRNFCATGVPQRFRLKNSAGEVVHNQLEVPNDATSWLDLSQVYGHKDADANVLRTLVNGRLKTADYSGIAPVSNGFPPNTPFSLTNMPPPQPVTGLPLDQNSFTPFTLFNLNASLFFSAGDMRLNENVVLLSFHTLFLREHNRLADRMKDRHPGWTDERIFQEARARNIAQYQNIVLYQYLPTILGSEFADKVGPYQGYKPNLVVDTDIAFAAAAFRYGHFTIHDFVALDQCGQGTLALRPSNDTVPSAGQIGGPITPVHNVLRPGSLENVFRGIIAQRSAPVTTGASPSLRDIRTNPGGTDVVSLDLARARLNGVPNYARLRDAHNNGNKRRIYGTPGCPEWYQREPELVDPIECFNHITDNNTHTVSPPENSLAYKMQQVYKKVLHIDPLIGLVAEPRVGSSSFGQTLGNMFASTYKKIRNADRLWFERTFEGDQLESIRDTSMGDIVRRNFPAVGIVPENPFLTPNNYVTRLRNQC